MDPSPSPRVYTLIHWLQVFWCWLISKKLSKSLTLLKSSLRPTGTHDCRCCITSNWPLSFKIFKPFTGAFLIFLLMRGRKWEENQLFNKYVYFWVNTFIFLCILTFLENRIYEMGYLLKSYWMLRDQPFGPSRWAKKNPIMFNSMYSHPPCGVPPVLLGLMSWLVALGARSDRGSTRLGESHALQAFVPLEFLLQNRRCRWSELEWRLS